MFEVTLNPAGLFRIGRVLIFKVNALYVVFFVLFGWLVTFAIVRVIFRL